MALPVGDRREPERMAPVKKLRLSHPAATDGSGSLKCKSSVPQRLRIEDAPRPVPGTRWVDSVWNERTYKIDIIKNLLIEEKTRMPLSGRSAYVPHRHKILQWVLQATEHLKLTPEVIQIAVYFTDRFVDGASHLFLASKLDLHLLVCLKLAAKALEWENNIPSNEFLQNLTHNRYELSEFVSHERKLLIFFQWRVSVPVVNSFLMAFKEYLLENADNESTERSLSAHTDYFESVSLRYISMQSALPSSVAAAIVVASRRLLNVRPHWPKAILSLMPKQETAIETHADILIKYLQNDTSQTAISLKAASMCKRPITIIKLLNNLGGG